MSTDARNRASDDGVVTLGVIHGAHNDRMRSAAGRRGRLVALCLVAVLALLAVLIVEGSADADSTRAQYMSQQRLLAADLQSAQVEGYGTDELQPILTARAALESGQVPVWIGERAGFYRDKTAGVARLRKDLKQLRTQLLDQSRQAASARRKEAADKIAEAGTLGADDADLQPLRAEFDQADKNLQAARTLVEFRASAKQLETLTGKASEIGSALKAELASIQQAAEQLKSQPLDGIVKAGKDALGSGRDEAVAATWLKISGFDRPYRLLEKYSVLVGSTELDRAATGTAAVQRYAGQIHQALLSGLPHKAIVLSITDQYLTAYEGGKLVQETYVTTGRPPDLSTDVGPMKVLRKDSPWKMHSPWPKGSPYWYPDAMVQRVVWFTITGEGLHDASWQPDGTYGPGSQYGPSASHGCVHVPPRSAMTFLYDWAEIGTPVVVIPGDGQPLAAQLTQKTTDDQGNPVTGPKGA
jgi:hypothetical protein